MFFWKKHGLIFKPQEVQGRSWLKEFAQAPATLIFDEFVRVYFSCRPEADKNGMYVSYTGFVDLDRKNLSKILRVSDHPILPLGELGTFDEFGVYPVSVYRREKDIIAYYGGWTRCESIPFTVSIGAATSHDNGETFQRLGKGPLLTSNLTDPFVLSGPKVRYFNGIWYLFYVAGTAWIPGNGRAEAIYKIRLAKSHDGIDWTRDGQDILNDSLPEAECQASPDVFFSNGKYHMFFCYKYAINFRGNDRGYRIGYASSIDLINWDRDDSKAGIGLSESGWDDQSIAYPHVFQIDDKVYMFYLGNGVGKNGFGLAELQGILD